jgi:hypothetical protein
MSRRERKIMRLLVSAWSEYLKLKKFHPDEVQEFKFSLHRLQDLIAYRVAKRAFPKEWP